MKKKKKILMSCCCCFRCRVGAEGALNVTKLSNLLNKPQAAAEEAAAEERVEDTITRSNEPDNLPDLGQPLQIHAKKGDVILLHGDLAHEGGPNYSGEIRRMIYLRLKYNLSNQGHFKVESRSLDLNNRVNNRNLTLDGCENWSQLEDLQSEDMWIDLPRVKQVLPAMKLAIDGMKKR